MTHAASELSPEDQIEILKQQLEHAQRMATLGDLMSTTTHEFNNLLMTIINYARLGLRNRDDETRDKALGKILSASERAARVTSTVLAVARNRSNTFEPTDVEKLIDDTLVLLEREMNKYRIAVEREIDSVPPARANGNQIQQVLINLLVNARQAMPNGGRVIIRLQHDAADNSVVLMIRDTGQGIAAEKLKQIFDPYFTTKSGPDETGKGGTGIGLSACRDILEAHQGRIRVESTLGRGTAFTIKLPVATAVRSVAGPAPTPAMTTPAVASSSLHNQ